MHFFFVFSCSKINITIAFFFPQMINSIYSTATVRANTKNFEIIWSSPREEKVHKCKLFYKYLQLLLPFKKKIVLCKNYNTFLQYTEAFISFINLFLNACIPICNNLSKKKKIHFY